MKYIHGVSARTLILVPFSFLAGALASLGAGGQAMAVTVALVGVSAAIVFIGTRAHDPVLIVFGTIFAVEYALRPSAILLEGVWGWNARTRQSLNGFEGEFIYGALGAITFALAIVLAYVMARKSPGQARSDLTWSGVPVLALVVAGGLLTVVVLESGSVSAGMQQGRVSISSGPILALTYAPVAAVLLTCIVAPPKAMSGTAGLRLSVYALVGVGATLLFVGGRAELVVLSLACFTALNYRGLLQINRRVLLIGLLLFGVLVGFRTLARDNFDASRQTSSSPGIISEVLGGDVGGFDKLMLLSSESDLLSPRWQGATYIDALRQVLLLDRGDRGIRGGNARFTAEFLPYRYATSPTREGITLFGEAVLNLGWVGATLFVGLLGGLLGLLVNAARSLNTMAIAAVSVIVGRMPGIIRGDALNSLNQAAILLGLLGLMALLPRWSAGGVSANAD